MAASQSIGASAAPSASKDGLIFNHDLLINPGDVEKIHQLYPKVAEFLDWPELRESFLLQDQLSKASKRRYQRRGFWTVALGVLALSLAASEPRLQGFHPWGLDAYLAIMVFLLSGASVFFGHSFMRGRVKDDWLHHRAAAERLRQLHFQWIVRRALHIATASTRKEKQELKNEREKQLVWLNERLQRGREPVVDLIVEDLAAGRPG